MRARQILRRLNDPRSVSHGVVSSAIVGALTLVEPRRLTPGSRLAYRGAVAAVTGWVVWATLRPRSAADLDLLGPLNRTALTAGTAGAALGLAEVGEAVDAKVHDRLVRSGVTRPRLWLAVGSLALGLASWAASRNDAGFSLPDHAGADEDGRSLVELPDEVRGLALRLLSATEEFGAPQLREQLATARLVRFADEEPELGYSAFEVSDAVARAVPGTATFPVVGRFRDAAGQQFGIRLFVEDGRLESMHIDEEDGDGAGSVYGAAGDADEAAVPASWPAPADVEVLVETVGGYRPLSASA